MTQLSKIIHLTIIFFLINSFSYAACLSENKIIEIINGFPDTPIKGISGDITLDEAYCSQEKYVQALKSINGKVIGYKEVLQEKLHKNVSKLILRQPPFSLSICL